MKCNNARIGVCNVAVAAVLAAVTSGCANQGFHLTGNQGLHAERLQRMILRPAYAERVANSIPASAKLNFEDGFVQHTNTAARVVAKQDEVQPSEDHYVLDAEVTKYSPGSPILRWLMTPVVVGGLWGSYVNVDYSLSDPSADEAIGSGVIRKANLWGGKIGRTITAESQLRACPKEILRELETFAMNSADPADPMEEE